MYLLPIGCLLVRVQLVCQQAQNELFRYQLENTTFSVPVEGIYMNHGWLVWMFLGAWVFCCYQQTKTWRTSPLEPIRQFWQHATTVVTPIELIVRIIVLEWIMFIPNVAWTMSLKRDISVTLSIATQQSQCVFVYLFSLGCIRCWQQQQQQQQQQHDSSCTRTWSPPLAVICCLMGVIIVTVGQSASGSAGNGNISNYLLLSVNPIFIAGFDLIFSRWSTALCRNTSDVCVLMALMGIACFTTCWPALFLDAESFQLPSPVTENGSLLYGNAALATCFNFGFMVGLSIMGPMFISVGAVLQLPLSALTDIIIFKRKINLATGLGGLLIMAGFLVLTIMGKHENDDDDVRENRKKLAAATVANGVLLENENFVL